MKGILKNKLLIVFSIFLILFFLFTTYTFASFNFSYNGITYSLTDLPFNQNDYDYVIFYCKGDYYVASLSEGYNVFFSDDMISLFFHGNKTYCCTIYKLLDNKWSEFIKVPRYSTGTLVGSSFSFNDDSSSVIYSTIDIYTNSHELVFQKTPVTVGEIIIPEITQVTEIPQVMGEIFKILIPIGLIIFLIGLMIYLVRLVTSQVI
ncbi:MAG: hypothetical protein HFJ37_03900 [Clostridia bacterium]|nr:hypothetical protein [Clostridia bacterium]